MADQKKQSGMFRLSPYLLFGGIALVVCGGLFYWLLFEVDWPVYYVWLVGCSVGTFLLYGLDKWQARGKRLRVPEIILFGLSPLGGFLGAFAGMMIWHHKTEKMWYWAVQFASVVFHYSLVVALGLDATI